MKSKILATGLIWSVLILILCAIPGDSLPSKPFLNIPHFDKPKLAASNPCLIIDVSLGGLQIESAQMFRSGDRVMILSMTLSDGGEPFSFKATVRWVSPLEDGLARCGCSFESLSLRDENRLCAAILQIQRNDLAQQRT